MATTAYRPRASRASAASCPHPGRRRLRRGPRRLQRHDRPPPGADRPVRDADDVVAAVNLARDAGPPAVGLRRRPRRDRRRGGRRRDLRRPARHEGHQRRPRGADGARRGRAQLGRVRRRDPGARARRHRRAGARHRHRRARARQRQRLARAQARVHVRQPDRGRGRHRRRAHGHGVGRPRTPSCSGGCAAAAATSASSPRSTSSCTRSGRSCSAGMLDVAGADGGRGRRASAATSCSTAPDEVGSGARVHHRAARADSCPSRCSGHPSSASSCATPGDVEEGERGARAAARVRSAGRRPGRADAVRRGAGAHRPRRTRTGMRNYWTADFSPSCPTRRSTCSSSTRPTRCRRSRQILLVAGGGAISRVPEDATAFGQRHAPWNIHYLSMWADPADDEHEHRVHARRSRRR